MYLEDVHTNVLGTPFVKPFQLEDKMFEHILSSYYVFTFVRNPFERILSAYLDKVANDRPECLEICSDLCVGSGRDVTFRDFLSAVESRLKIGQYVDKHWRPQYLQCGSGTIQLRSAGKVESIDKDFSRILKDLGCSSDRLITINPHATNAKEKIAQYYDNDCRDRVVRMYKDDFEQFGYDTVL